MVEEINTNVLKYLIYSNKLEYIFGDREPLCEQQRSGVPTTSQHKQNNDSYSVQSLDSFKIRFAYIVC